MTVSKIPPSSPTDNSKAPPKEDPSKQMQEKVKEFYDKLKEPDEEEPDEGDPD